MNFTIAEGIEKIVEASNPNTFEIYKAFNNEKRNRGILAILNIINQSETNDAIISAYKLDGITGDKFYFITHETIRKIKKHYKYNSGGKILFKSFPGYLYWTGMIPLKINDKIYVEVLNEGANVNVLGNVTEM